MSRVAINTGSVANDGTGDSLRIAGGIINDNFSEIYSQFGDGTNLTPTWNKTAAGVNTTSNVGIGTTNPRFKLEVGSVGASGTSLWVNGNARVTGILTVGSSSIILDGNTNKILVGSGISFDGNTGIISATAFYAGGTIITGGGGSGDSYWVSGATGVTTTSNVGIATNSAPSALTVGGNSLFSGIATFRNNVTLSNVTSSSNTLTFGSNSYIDQSTSDVLTFQINTGTDSNSTDGSFVFRTTEPNISPIPDFQLDALRVYSRGDYWNGLVRVYTDLHVDDNAFVGGDLQVGAASTLIGAGSTLGSFKVGAGGTVITTTSAGLVGIGTSVPNSNLHVVGVSTFNGSVYIDDQLYVSGIEITGSDGGGGVSIGDDIVTRNLKSTGITTLGVSNILDLTVDQINSAGIITSNSLSIGSTEVISSSRELKNIISLDSITTQTIESAIADAPNLFTNLQVAGISTLGITSTTDLKVQQLNVSGISTFSGITTVTGSTLFSKQLNVSGVSTFFGSGEFTNSFITVHRSGLNPEIKLVDSSDNTYIGMYYDTTSTESYLISDDKNLNIKVNAPQSISLLSQEDYMALFESNGGVSLYYDGSKKLEVTSIGATITGSFYANEFIGDGSNLTNVSSVYSSVAGISTVSQGIVGVPNINVGVVTASGLRVTGVATFNGSAYIDNQLYVSGVQITGVGETGSVASIGEDISTRNLSVSGISTFSGNISVGGTISVDGGVQLVTNNPTIIGTAATTGEIKQIGGAPFFYDGSAWREFVLSSGTPISVPADTDWDNVILRSTYDTDFDDVKFSVSPAKVGSGSTIVASPRKIGTGSFRNDGSVGAGVSFAYRPEYDFTGPWTIEFWYYHDTDPTQNTPVSLVSMNSYTDGSGNWALALNRDSVSNMRFIWYNHQNGFSQTLYETSGAVFSSIFDNKWVHLALVREPEDGSLHFYVDGYEDNTWTGSTIDNNILNISGAGLGIGGNGYGGFTAITTINNGITIDAHFDDIRITTDARYTSVGIATTVFTPPTTALPTTGTLSSYVQPPGDKYGELTLGGSPTWRGTSGVTVSQQSSGNYRVSFASTYTNANDYYVLSNGMDQGFASYVGIARSTTHVDLAINKQSDDTAVDTGSLSVQITNHT